jgi:hypothetical protein
MKKIFEFLLWPWRKYQQHRAWKKRLAELKKRDPFIYK